MFVYMNNKVVVGLVVATALVLIVAIAMDRKQVEAPTEVSPDVTASTTASTTDAVAVETAGDDSSTVSAPAPQPGNAGTVSAPAASAPRKPVQVIPQSNAVVLLDTKSTTIITVASARLTKPGFIALYRTNNNEETEYIGHSDLLQPGSYTNVLIQASSPVARKQVVTAVLHEDDGDGVFEFPVSDSYLKNGTRLAYDEDVVDVPIVEEAGLINGTVEAHLEDAVSRM